MLDSSIWALTQRSLQNRYLFWNWKQLTLVKPVESALQYIKVYVAGVSANTAEWYFKNIEEQVIQRQTKVWSNLKYF